MTLILVFLNLNVHLKKVIFNFCLKVFSECVASLPFPLFPPFSVYKSDGARPVIANYLCNGVWYFQDYLSHIYYLLPYIQTALQIILCFCFFSLNLNDERHKTHQGFLKTSGPPEKLYPFLFKIYHIHISNEVYCNVDTFE